MVSRRYFAVCLAVIAAVMSIAGCAWAAEERVGGINPQAILFQHPKYEQTLKQIEVIANNKMNAADEAIKKAEGDDKKRELFQNVRQQIAEEEQKLMQPLFSDIDRAIRTVANQKKVTVVIDNTALFYGGVDLTDDVVQELKKQSLGGK